MRVFDCNCFIGSRSADVPGVDGSAGGLLEEMDRLGIQEALVWHVLAKEGHPLDGNEAVLKETAAHPRLHPCWAVLPPASGEMPPPGRLVEAMKAAGVRAARLFPVAHKFPFTLLNLGDLLEALQERRIPLLVDYDLTHWSQDPAHWPEVVRVATRFPRLPLIFVGYSIQVPRAAYSAMRQAPRLCFETSCFQPQRGLEEVAERFDASRLLFGTRMPYRSAGPPLAMLQMSRLSPQDKGAMAGGNLRRLLDMPAESSGSHDACKHGFRVFDAHAHLGRWFSTAVAHGEAEGLVRDMDAYGVEAAVVSSFQGIGCAWKEGNRQVADAARAFPGRLYGYAVANPNHREEIRPELEWCFRQDGFVGIKLHCELHGYPLEHPAYEPALEFAHAHELPMLIHGGNSRGVLEPLLKRFGKAKILTAHAGTWDGRAALDTITMAAQHENLFLDLSSSSACQGALERMVEIAGIEKVIFGSDLPLLDEAYQMGRVLHARLTQEQKQAILYGNARRLFRLKD